MFLYMQLEVYLEQLQLYVLSVNDQQQFQDAIRPCP